MLATGKGFISNELLKELLGLPDDSIIMGIDRDIDGVTFHIVSENEVEGKLHKGLYGANVRRFSIDKEINDLRKQGENHDS